MAPKKKAGKRVVKSTPKKGTKPTKKIKTSGAKPIDPLHLAPGVRTSQTTI